MKPCSNNRERIAGLALGALDARQEQGLRAHLETCGGCRRYLDEVSAVTDKLAATQIRSDIQATESFHQRVTSALRAEKKRPAWETLLALPLLRAGAPAKSVAAGVSRRLAWSSVGAAALVILVMSVLVRQASVPPPAAIGTHAVSQPKAERDLDPTISNYQLLAHRSLDQLDDLLTRQGNHNPPSTPIYTASTLARANALE